MKEFEANAGELAAGVFESNEVGGVAGLDGAEEDFHGAGGGAIGASEGDGVGIVIVSAIPAAHDDGKGAVEVREESGVNGEERVLSIEEHVAHLASPLVSGYVGCLQEHGWVDCPSPYRRVNAAEKCPLFL